MTQASRPRILVVVAAIEAEPSLTALLARVPASLAHACEVTFLSVGAEAAGESLPSGVRRLSTGHAWPYGELLKAAFQYGIDERFQAIAVVGRDTDHAVEVLPVLIAPIVEGRADVVAGSRVLDPSGSRHRVAFYRHLGHRLLTWVQNRLVRSHWTDVHAGVWAYSAAALKRIPFAFNSSGPAFDAEVAIQAGLAGVRCVEVAVPSRAHRRLGVVAGLTYAWDVTLACVKARAQELSLFFDRKFDCLPSTVSNIHYKPRLGFASTHTMALDRIPAGSRVLDIGCAGGDLGRMLRERGCTVVGVDRFPLEPGNTLDGFHLHDLNTPLPVDVSSFDYAAMLDVIEHLQSPETFVDDFKARAERNPNLRLILSTPNIGFIVNRLMLAAGQFNYGKRGILDLTHTRLFTFGTFRRLFEQSGFEIVELTGVPAPFPLALGDTLLARVLLSMHQGLIRVSRRLFAFQIFAIVRSKPGLAYLLNYVPENAAAKPTASLDR